MGQSRGSPRRLHGSALGTGIGSMTRPASEGGSADPYLVFKARQHHRLGVGLILSGIVLLVGSTVAGVLFQMNYGQATEWPGSVGVGLIGAAGFGMILAGAVFFVESRAFLRRLTVRR
jgi:hypothetical protein